MKPQARPFSVEIKSRRRNAPPAVPASAAPHDDWMDTIPPDDLPERDVHEDLSDGPSQSEARREAERVFARLNAQAQPSGVKDDPAPGSPIATPEAPAPRVLPDLLAGAREEERTMVEKPKRTRVPKPTKVKRSRKTKSPEPRLERPEPALEPAAKIAPEPTGEAQATMSQSRRAKQRASKLPPGQRWKERRLPRVSWERQVRSR